MGSLQEYASPNAPAELSQDDFAFFSDLIFQLAGIHMDNKKRDLIVSRLRSYMNKNGVQNFSHYRETLKGLPADHPAMQNFVNLLTTNKTDFFREPRHFDYLAETVIPTWVTKKEKGPFLAWSCASSSGEEPYTLSMALGACVPKDRDYKILATDIDTRILERARNGVYPVAKLKEIPENYRATSVVNGHGKAQGYFKIADPIFSKVAFKHHNLQEATYPGDEMFDLIMCRNVLIYFSTETIQTLMHKLHRSLKTGGTLMIGHSESINGCQHLFKTIRPSVFVKI